MTSVQQSYNSSVDDKQGSTEFEPPETNQDHHRNQFKCSEIVHPVQVIRPESRGKEAFCHLLQWPPPPRVFLTPRREGFRRCVGRVSPSQHKGFLLYPIQPKQPPNIFKYNVDQMYLMPCQKKEKHISKIFEGIFSVIQTPPENYVERGVSPSCPLQTAETVVRENKLAAPKKYI